MGKGGSGDLMKQIQAMQAKLAERKVEQRSQCFLHVTLSPVGAAECVPHLGPAMVET